MNDVRVGLARGLLFGMQPGVRYGPTFALGQGGPPEQMQMLRGVAQLTRRAADYLVLGRMLPEPKISDSPVLEPPAGQRGPRLPIPWSAVQGTAWMSPRGNVCYAVANLSAGPVSPQIELGANGMKAGHFDLKLMKSEGEEALCSSVTLPMRITLPLQAWEVCCIEQTASAAKKKD
jgi:hypothetical protein